MLYHCNRVVDVLLNAIPETDATVRDRFGLSPLCVSARTCNPAGTRMLLARNKPVDVNLRCAAAYSALHDAIQVNCTESGWELLNQRHIDVNLCHRMGGETPLMMALRYGRPQFVRWLLLRGDLDVNLSCNRWTALNLCATEPVNLGLCGMLMKRRDLNHSKVDYDGNTALHYAAESGNAAFARMLLKARRIPVNLRNHNGATAFDYAIELGQREIAEAIETSCNCTHEDLRGKNKRKIAL